MRATGVREQSALMADLILSAMLRGDLPDLETGLEEAERLASASEAVIPDVGEQLELLGAVASHMRQSISRFHRHVTPRLEGMEVSLQLLRHLAGSSSAVAVPYAKRAAARAS